MELLSETTPKARRNYHCDGWLQIDYYYNEAEWESETKEWLDILGDKHCIEKGQIYINRAIKDGGDISSWRSCHKCCELIDKYEYYDEGV